MKLARLNNEGLHKFELFLDSLAINGALNSPKDLLSAADTIVNVSGDVEIEDRKFASRFEAARYLHDVLPESAEYDILRDIGLWSWLTLFFFDQVCLLDGNGLRKVGERARYIPATDYQKYYRHLLAGPYRVLRAHRDDPKRALILLCGPLHKPGEIVEQLVARQEIITNPHAVALATRLYYDPDSGTFRRGAAGKGGGSARRLADMLRQFDVTWDLYSMESAGLRDLLPAEFDRFRGVIDVLGGTSGKPA